MLKVFLNTKISSTALLFFTPLVYLLLAATICSLLAYPLHFLIGDSVPYYKIINRGSLLLLVLGIYPAIKLINLTEAQVGFCGFSRAFFRRFGIGLVLGILILGFLIAAFLLLEIRVIDWSRFKTVSGVFSILLSALATGTIVASVEEPLFRGLLLGALTSRMPGILALNISAFYYASLHFLRSKLSIPDSELNWLSGFDIIVDSFAALFNTQLIDSFSSLFFAGIFLGLVKMKTKCGLGFCIGLHAGWVFVIKATKSLTDTHAGSAWSGLVGNYDRINGFFSAGWLLVLIGCLLLFYGTRAK